MARQANKEFSATTPAQTKSFEVNVNEKDDGAM
jgi:hypothetical protein